MTLLMLLESVLTLGDLLPTAGQYLRARPDEELVPLVAKQWAETGLLRSEEATPFVTAAVKAAKKSLVRTTI